MPKVNRDDMAEYITSLPSICEQKDIVGFVEDKFNKLDDEKSQIEREIELMKEYKTVLISEAVTGKIDVRNL